MRQVTKRKVSRWFYKGKGYASETAAYTKMAKDALNKELGLDNTSWTFGVDPSEITAKVTELYAAKFPHFTNEFGYDCTMFGKCASAYETDMDIHGNVYQKRTFRYDWCKTAYQNWLRDKVAELKEAANSPSTESQPEPTTQTEIQSQEEKS